MSENFYLQFLSLFREFGGCPAVWDLHEWSGWLTPSSSEKRFDTAFYITFIDEISDVTSDKCEMEELQVSVIFPNMDVSLE